jgi:hypothetical protein
MPFRLSSPRTCVFLCSLAMAALAAQRAMTQETQPQFGGEYSKLDPRRQQLVDNWVSRFSEATGQKVAAGALYDDIVTLSAKTTFEAITHALITTPLTDSSGARLGDALSLVERVEAVKGQIPGASGDHQFRMYARLRPDAVDVLDRSKEFERRADNSVYHKGYPINYREQRRVPSIQFSIAPDGRRADIDVDYRSSSFPVALFNGHLSASNSDVRAGNNYDRHVNQWTGLQNWWRSFLGVRLERPPDDASTSGLLTLPPAPRAGKKNIDVMVNDFLNAWLVEGDVVAAMGYVSERAYACLAQDREDPTDFDRGMAPYQLMIRLRDAHQTLGTHTSLEGLTRGVRYTRPGLKVVNQPHHAQFVIYSAPDDVAAAFDCESRLTVSDPKKARQKYGNYYGATFNVGARKDQTVALLWGKENGYWKIVSWQTGADERDTPVPDPPPVSKIVRIPADTSLVQAARDFLESWLIRKDYDAAFRYVSTKSYACYDLLRSPAQPAATSLDDAGRQIRAGLERAGNQVGQSRGIEEVLTAVEPSHPAVRVMDQPYSRTFSLTSVPNALADAADCGWRASGGRFPKEVPLEYGRGFAMNIRFRTQNGDAPVLRVLWARENGAWRITAYDIEVP